MKTVSVKGGMVVLHFCTLYFFPMSETENIYYERLMNDKFVSETLDDVAYLENKFLWMKRVSSVGDKAGFLDGY